MCFLHCCLKINFIKLTHFLTEIGDIFLLSLYFFHFLLCKAGHVLIKQNKCRHTYVHLTCRIWLIDHGRVCACSLNISGECDWPITIESEIGRFYDHINVFFFYNCNFFILAIDLGAIVFRAIYLDLQKVSKI